MVVENLGATEASQLKKDATAYKRQRHLRRRCVGHDRSPKFRPLTMTSGDTSDGRCEGQDRSPSLERPRADVMARYKWTCVYPMKWL